MSGERLSRQEMKKYSRVRDEKDKAEAAPVNDLMVSAAKDATPYIRRALILFNGDPKDESAEKFRTVTVMGRGRAVNLVVQIAEMVKRRVKGLHQISRMEFTTVTDHYKAKPSVEEDLKDLHFERTVGGLHITLSLDELDTTNSGYQPPLPEEEVKDEELPKRKPRSKKPKAQATSGRGGRGSANAAAAGGRGSGSENKGRGGGGRGGRGGGGAASTGRGSGRSRGRGH